MQRLVRIPWFLVAGATVALGMASNVTASTIAFYDFRTGDHGWRHVENGSIADLAYTAEGMVFRVVAEDPYVWGPREDYPAGKPVRMTFRMRSTGDPFGEVFYGRTFAPDRRVPFPVRNDGAWHNYRVDLPALGEGARVRIDPAHAAGDIGIAWVRTEAEIESEVVAFWDFTQGTHGWEGNFHVDNLQVTAEGLDFDSIGNDPWLTSPPVDFQGTFPLTFAVRMRSTADSAGRLYWGEIGFSEERAAPVPVIADGQFHETVGSLPALGGRVLLRFDPATTSGHITIEWIRIATVVPVDPPPLERPNRPEPGAEPPLHVSSGRLTLEHYGRRWGGYTLHVDGVEMAGGHEGDILGYMHGALPAFEEIREWPATVTLDGGVLEERVDLEDTTGGNWTLRRTFEPGPIPGSLRMHVEAACDRDHELVHFPWLTLFPGLGCYGTNKTQAVLAGVEYLENEPSSSQADLTVPAHVRLVPHPDKLTFPLVALSHMGRCIGVVWERSDTVAVVHDSPDRVFHSDAHLIGLWAPGVGERRDENSLFAGVPIPVAAGVPVAASVILLGDVGAGIVPAVQGYVSIRGLPAVPGFEGGFDAAVELLAAGWTLSACYDGNGHWRHAVWPGFGAQVAADAVCFAGWLAERSSDPATVARLEDAARLGLLRLTEADPTHVFAQGVSHVRWPSVNLLLGDLPAHLANRAAAGSSRLALFDADGIRRYVPQPGKPDYSSTHFADHANGYAGAALAVALEAAAMTGARGLIDAAVAMLDRQTEIYAATVPRGAQTWEVPLHTPDILASANMLKCYVLAYEMTGRRDLLDEAIYWAWTGVPFIYLDRSAPGEIGDYATIAVLGATNWVAPVWLGLPVQWCGLPYRSWLHRLAPHDPEGPWDSIARGITGSGLQQTWPFEDAERQGLLPDFFLMRTQHRDGPAINPGTLQANLPELFGEAPLYGFLRDLRTGWCIHAPGPVDLGDAGGRCIEVSTPGRGSRRYRMLFSGVAEAPASVTVIQSGTPLPASYDYRPDDGWLIVRNLQGSVTVRICSPGSDCASMETY